MLYLLSLNARLFQNKRNSVKSKLSSFWAIKVENHAIYHSQAFQQARGLKFENRGCMKYTFSCAVYSEKRHFSKKTFPLIHVEQRSLIFAIAMISLIKDMLLRSPQTKV